MNENTTALPLVKWNTRIPVERKSDYIVRFTELVFAPSSAGNPMITLKSEIAAPDTVECQIKPGEYANVTMAGAKCKDQYFTITKMNPDGSTEAGKGREFWNALLAKLELPEETNWDNPDIESIKKVLAYALINDEETPQTASLTRDEIAKGIKVGKPLLHPKTKEPLITHYPVIKEIYCRAELPTSGGGL